MGEKSNRFSMIYKSGALADESSVQTINRKAGRWPVRMAKPNPEEISRMAEAWLSAANKPEYVALLAAAGTRRHRFWDAFAGGSRRGWRFQEILQSLRESSSDGDWQTIQADVCTSMIRYASVHHDRSSSAENPSSEHDQ